MVHRRQLEIVVALGLAALLSVACAPVPEPADLVLRGGRIITVNPARPEVEALAARGQEIVALGTEDEVAPLIGLDTEVLDLAGAVAYPGLIEGHAHFLSLGRSRQQLELRAARSWDEIVSLVAEAAAHAETGQWIRGRGWHQDKWDAAPEPSVEGMPVHEALSRVAPDNPVILAHASGHAVIVNAAAMRVAGITARTPDPAGGQILRSANGSPTGVLRETAEEMVSALIPAPSDAEIRQYAKAAVAECLAKGITSFQDAGSTLREVGVLRHMADSGELELRLWLMLGEDNETIAPVLDQVRVTGAGSGFLSVAGIKRYMDGALGSRGAWLLEPYADAPDGSGLRIDSEEALRESARLAREHGYQLCIHAIGDRANREVLDLYEASLAGLDDRANRRWRIEHAQHLLPDDVPRFAELGVIAAMQPTHCVSDGPWVPDRLGDDRARTGAYLWRELLDAGAVIATGTDAPVEDVDPIATFHAAVTREMGNGEAFYPMQCMSRPEALEAATIRAAYSVFEEERKGSLELGKLADITVLDRDILHVPADQIRQSRVLYTIVGGELRYSAE